MTTQPLWRPDAEARACATVTAFMKAVNPDISDFAALHAWSVTEPALFWRAVWDCGGVIGDRGEGPVVDDVTRMPGAKWFEGARLNYAENLLRRRDEGEALVFWGEDRVKRRLSYRDLYDQVSLFAQGLAERGVGVGDRVAGYLPNLPEAVIAMLATSSLGAVWSSASPDFGVNGVIDRFGQIEPKVFICADGYVYNGKRYSSTDKLPAILQGLPSVEHVIVVPYTGGDLPEGAERWESVVAEKKEKEIEFKRLPFGHPLFILFSSGTTGVPKCIVHGAGGTLLQHIKEHLLHCNIRRDDRVFYFTTCGWMMWNWLVSALACEATLLLYDGAPMAVEGDILFDYADAEGMTLFGTSAKYIDAVHKAGMKPKESHQLNALRTMTSTGSPLAPESFDFVYEHIKADLHLASISGGTDIISCFMLGNPTGPVWRGEIQTAGLGMKVEVFDEGGRPVVSGKGELVCTQAFPSQPVGFWNDPEGAKYRAAYFERFPGVWTHGDWVEATDHGGFVIHGRSDATLNPGGVRIGTAEIYRQVERLPEVLESLVVGQDWEGDVRVVLFVRLREGLALDEDLTARIKGQIRTNCTPRHVPAVVLRVPDLPRTKSGKITELAVREVIHGRPVKNLEALANPEALEAFRNRVELKSPLRR